MKPIIFLTLIVIIIDKCLSKSLLRNNKLIFLKKDVTKPKNDDADLKQIDFQPVQFVNSVSQASKAYFDILKSGE